MTGRRKHNPLGLPARVYERHGAVHYVDHNGRWHRLGALWDRAARLEWAKLSGGEPERGSMAELIDAFLVHCRGQVAAGKRAPRTLADNEIEADNLKVSLGHIPAPKLKRKHATGYLEAGLKADRAVRANREISFLSSAFSWGIRNFGLEEIPATACVATPSGLGTDRPKDGSCANSRRNTARRGCAATCCSST